VKSCEFLDSQRLGKQRVEAAQILEILLNTPILPVNVQSVVPFDRSTSRWANHPAVNMWSGHEEWLKFYLQCAIGEWTSRDYRNNIVVPRYDLKSQPGPSWLGHAEFHDSHKSNLVRKFPAHYRQHWPEQDPSLRYFWPTQEGFAVVKIVGGK
jgi:hypothetical protein